MPKTWTKMYLNMYTNATNLLNLLIYRSHLHEWRLKKKKNIKTVLCRTNSKKVSKKAGILPKGGPTCCNWWDNTLKHMEMSKICSFIPYGKKRYKFRQNLNTYEGVCLCEVMVNGKYPCTSWHKKDFGLWQNPDLMVSFNDGLSSYKNVWYWFMKNVK